MNYQSGSHAADFELNQRLQSDTFFLGSFDLSMLLLMNDERVPWFILVPKISGTTDLFQLSEVEANMLAQEVRLVSAFLKTILNVDKVNIAAIGNIVEQLHIHIVGRYKNDPLWPGVVWGQGEARLYSSQRQRDLQSQFNEFLEMELANP